MDVSTQIPQILPDGAYVMNGNKRKGDRINLPEIFGACKGGLKGLLREVFQEGREQEMTNALRAEKGD